MAHLCPFCLVTCEDFRLHRRADGSSFVDRVIESLGGDCDVITRGGAAQDLVRGEAGFAENLLRDLAVSVELHQVRTVVLMNHADCGAYGGMTFADREAELEQHRRDLREAGRILADRFADVEIRLLLAEQDPADTDRFVSWQTVPPAG